MWLALAVAAVPATAGLCFLAYLLFLGFVSTKTGGTDGLKDVTVVMRAYKVPLFNRTSRNQIEKQRRTQALPVEAALGEHSHADDG